MKTFHITFQSHSSIAMLATQLNVELKEDCTEQIIELPEKFGSGKISGFQYGDGVGLLLFECIFKDHWTIEFDRKNTPPLQFNLSVKGGMRHSFNNRSTQYSLDSPQGTITADLLDSYHGFEFPRNEQIIFACLMINRKKYTEKINCFIEKMPERLGQAFLDILAQKPFFYKGNYSINSSECVQTILTDKHIGLVRSTFLEGVTLELLSHQIKQFRDDSLPHGKQITLRKQDIEKIIEAKTFLLENLQKPITIEALSKKVGINQTKLKAGFKKIFDKPVKTWLRDKRLEISKLLILEGELSMKEISENIGYQNQSHFSARFKEKYGVLPKDFAKSVKIKLADFK